MRSARPARTPLLAAVSVLAAVLATGCSTGDDGSRAAGAPATGSTAAGSGTPAGQGAPAAPSGPACAGLPAEGPGSPAVLAGTPLGTAVGATPLLGTLAGVVQNANLVDALNSASDVTLLAPVGPAFDAVPRATLDPLLANTPQLTRLLTHHVLQGRLAPEQLPGEHATLAGDRVTVTGSGGQLSLAGDQTLAGAGPAAVVCGPLQTANATVYVVDQVLAPAG